jgi:hypothetical protein
MTANRTHRNTSPGDKATSQTADIHDTLTTARDVPSAVWRLATRGADTATTRIGPEFRSRLMRQLVLNYTTAGDAIVDFDGDGNLRVAAIAAKRFYVALTSGRRVADLDLVTSSVNLAVLRWPRPTSPATPAAISDLLLGLQFIVTTTSSVLAVISTIGKDHTSTSADPQVTALLHAARAARFTHEQRILALGGDEDRDTYTYYPSDSDADADLNRWRATTRPGVRIDILRFATRTRHDD